MMKILSSNSSTTLGPSYYRKTKIAIQTEIVQVRLVLVRVGSYLRSSRLALRIQAVLLLYCFRTISGTNIHMLAFGDYWSSNVIDIYLHRRYAYP
ncbi:hypothetical protein L6164_013822 [Bauhinia variegata]|uniref:Uncharacterized protein n=1 Tax=Bauhinia variegata TaxID=167791 RepID=A0ACB9NHD4_BAUVA|nr:hypothetical protein L6164_013822 [Bauhinia variegata]